MGVAYSGSIARQHGLINGGYKHCRDVTFQEESKVLPEMDLKVVQISIGLYCICFIGFKTGRVAKLLSHEDAQWLC